MISSFITFSHVLKLKDFRTKSIYSSVAESFSSLHGPTTAKIKKKMGEITWAEDQGIYLKKRIGL